MKINDKVLGIKELYSGASSNTITLSDDASNYSYIEIFYYTDTSSSYKSVKVPSPNSKNVELNGTYDNGTYLYLWTETATISGTSITRGTQARWRIAQSGGASTRTTGSAVSLNIVKVIGYV